MSQEYINPASHFYQPRQSELVIPDAATDSQVSDLKKWIIVSIVSNIAISIAITGFLIFIYYTLLIENG